MPRPSVSLSALLLAVCLALPAVAQELQPPANQTQQPPANQAQQPASRAETAAAAADFVELAPRLIPAVVNISARLAPTADGRQPSSPFPPGSPFEDFFRDFFGPRQQTPPPDAQRRAAAGSGFIIDPAGYIVTNNHVIENAERVTVVLQDESQYEAQVVGRDPRTDLALIKIEAAGELPYVRWGDSEGVRIGEPVLAIGNPFGLGGSVTSGIISALARDIGVGPYDEFLQTDASINRGNSGGPLFNQQGEVIGVNTAIFSPTGVNIGIGFATPSSLAQSVIEELRERGEVHRGWIGVVIQRVNDEVARALGLEESRGVLVSEVQPGSPAEAAGIQIGDAILEFNGRTVNDRNRLPRMVGDTEIGSTVSLTVWRDGQAMTLEIRVGDLRQAPGVAEAEPPAPPQPAQSSHQRGLGLSLAPLAPELRNRLGIGADVAGVVVSGVEPGSLAAERGIEVGDVILRVGQEQVTQPQEVEQAVSQARERGDESILVLLRRDQANRFVALPLAS